MHLSSIFLLSLGGVLLVKGDDESSSTCVCTTVPCPVEGKNFLEAGGGGHGEFTYILNSDEIPIVSSARYLISSKDLDKGTDTTSCTRAYSRGMDDDGTEDCDAGHILANRLGGYGNHTLNIFPQDLSVNRGAFSQFENGIYWCIESGAPLADLSWKFSYETDTKTKPYEIEYTAVFEEGGSFEGVDCTVMSDTFRNE